MAANTYSQPNQQEDETVSRMLEITCSKCGHRTYLEKVEDLTYSQYCDKCGQPTQISVSNLLPHIQPTTDHTTPIRRLSQLFSESSQEKELEGKIEELNKHEKELNRNI